MGKMTWHWQCLNLGKGPAFAEDYAIVAKNAAGLNVVRQFSATPYVADEDLIAHVRALVRSMLREIEKMTAR